MSPGFWADRQDTYVSKGRPRLPGVHEERAAMLAEHLDVRVPAGHHRRRDAAPSISSTSPGRCVARRSSMCERGRAVEEAQRCVRRARRRARAGRCARNSSSPARAARHQSTAATTTGRLGVLANELGVEQEGVVVADDAGASELASVASTRLARGRAWRCRRGRRSIDAGERSMSARTAPSATTLPWRSEMSAVRIATSLSTPKGQAGASACCQGRACHFRRGI